MKQHHPVFHRPVFHHPVFRRPVFHHPASREAERGSVFMVTLMALVLLTAIGLSLTLLTETEMLLGSNEQIITENFYAAETGIAVAVGQAMLGTMANNCFATLGKEEGDLERRVGVNKLGYSIDTTALYPVAFDVAPYTKANEGRSDVLYSGFFRAQTRSLRGTWPAEDDVPREPGEELEDTDFTIQARKSLDVAFFLSPIEARVDLRAFDHPESLGCEKHPDHEESVCAVTEDPEASCDDGADNDCDDLTDCADTDCSGDPACAP